MSLLLYPQSPLGASRTPPHLEGIDGLRTDQPEGEPHDALLVVHLDRARDQADGVPRVLLRGASAPRRRIQLAEEAVIFLAVVVQQAMAVQYKVPPLPRGHRGGAALVQEALTRKESGERV